MTKDDIGFAAMTGKAELPPNLDMLLLQQGLIALIKAIDAQFLSTLELSSVAN